MSPRVAFWTSAFDAHMEAIASEVALLRRHFPSSISWGLHRSRWMQLSRKNGFCLHPKLHLLFRAATRLAERRFDVNHVFGSAADWFYLAPKKTRPTVLTIAACGDSVEPELLQRVDRFAIEFPAARQELHRAGIDDGRIDVVLPPVDLDRFYRAPKRDGPFTVLFASSPEDPAWLEARGLPLLLEAASGRPQFRFRLLWRPWGDSLPAMRQLVAERELQNVEIVTVCVDDMVTEYQQADVTIAPFTDRSRCKPAPNSLIESLACGRPVLCTTEVGIADLIAESACGRVATPEAEAVVAGLDQIQADWQAFSKRARTAAEIHFEQNQFLKKYERVYSDLLGPTSVAVASSIQPSRKPVTPPPIRREPDSSQSRPASTTCGTAP